MQLKTVIRDIKNLFEHKHKKYFQIKQKRQLE